MSRLIIEVTRNNTLPPNYWFVAYSRAWQRNSVLGEFATGRPEGCMVHPPWLVPTYPTEIHRGGRSGPEGGGFAKASWISSRRRATRAARGTSQVALGIAELAKPLPLEWEIELG